MDEENLDTESLKYAEYAKKCLDLMQEMKFTFITGVDILIQMIFHVINTCTDASKADCLILLRLKMAEFGISDETIKELQLEAAKITLDLKNHELE